MRFAMALVSLLAFVGCNSAKQDAVTTSVESSASNVQESRTAESTEVKTVAVKVTGMMCPHGCYPQVKSLITKQNTVESIELTPQIQKDVIDNPVVLVKYRGKIDREATTKAIIEAGFEKVEYTEQ